jgi:hypothetical protein
LAGAGAVSALVLLECTVGLVAGAAWTQSWAVVRRGHFRIVGWAVVALGALAAVAGSGALDDAAARADLGRWLLVATAAAAAAYLVVQYARSDRPGVVVGYAAAAVGACALIVTATLIPGWPAALAAAAVLVGAVLAGAVINGMLLGHWYLNQPGLKPWALARLTNLSLIAAAASGAAGAAGAVLLMGASTEGAAFGLSGAGGELAPAFFFIWLLLVAFTGVVVWMAHRCTRIRSIQSATGLMYVAILTAGVAEFLVRYLMVNAA